jgi:hypothetical protein
MWRADLPTVCKAVLGLLVTLYTTRFNIKTFYIMPTECIYVFCMDVKANSDYLRIQIQLIGFYNRDELCLLGGMNLAFK